MYLDGKKSNEMGITGNFKIFLDDVEVNLECTTECETGIDGYVIVTDNPPVVNEDKTDIIKYKKEGKVELIIC